MVRLWFVSGSHPRARTRIPLYGGPRGTRTLNLRVDLLPSPRASLAYFTWVFASPAAPNHSGRRHFMSRSMSRELHRVSHRHHSVWRSARARRWSSKSSPVRHGIRRLSVSVAPVGETCPLGAATLPSAMSRADSARPVEPEPAVTSMPITVGRTPCHALVVPHVLVLRAANCALLIRCRRSGAT